MNADSSKHSIPDNPKAACEKYINELDEEYYSWYSREAACHIKKWNIITRVATLSGFVAALFAAIFQYEQLNRFVWAQIALIILPMLASLASTYLVQMRISELIPVWERGRRDIQNLIAQGGAKFAAASTSAEYTAIHLWLVEQAHGIELEAADEFVRGLSDSK
jgi:hypothetical protein